VQTAEKGTAILIIPMQGQMHTDIRFEAFELLTERIKEAKPDYILIEMLSRDWRNDFHQLMSWGDRQEFSGYDKNDLMAIAKFFHIELKSIPQVMWVQDASGASTLLSLSWPTMYMSQNGSLHATMGVSRQFDYINTTDTHGKIREAALAHTKALATYGKRSPALLRAFTDPEVPLSGTWKGKKVEWVESLDGDFIIDDGPGMPHLTASTATEVGISVGNVRSRNDVLLAMGIREYHLVGEDITQELADYVIAWRKEFEKASEAWLDAAQFSEWATGDDTIQYMKKQINALKLLLRKIQKSPAVALRIQMKYRVSKDYLTRTIEQLGEALDNFRNGGRGGGGGAGGGGRGGGGGGRR
jgi:uncharacterized membrane protein YgcG